MDTNKQSGTVRKQWLPLYLKGLLASPQQEWMERYLAQHPEAQAEVRFNRVLGEKLCGKPCRTMRRIWVERLLTRLRAEDAATKA